MRTLNQPAAAIIAEATEPIAILQIDWGPPVGTRFYADKDISNGFGQIRSLSSISSSQTADQIGMTSQCSAVLDDFDTVLKQIIDTAEIEGRPVTIFHKFANQAGLATEIFTGQIGSPIVWDERERTLSFDIVITIETNQVGFSVDSGQFNANNDVAIGKAWPIVMGKPAHQPTILVQTIPQSRLVNPLSLGGNLFEDGMFDKLDDELKDIELTKTSPRIESILASPVNSGDLVVASKDTIFVEEGEKFPQDTNMEIEINGVIFRGSFQAGGGDPVDEFTVTAANVTRYQNLQCAGRSVGDIDFDNPKVLWLARSDVDIANNLIVMEWTSKDSNGITTLKHEFFNRCIRQEGTKCWFEFPFEVKKMSGGQEASSWEEETDGSITRYGLATVNTKIFETRVLARNGLIIDLEQFTVDMRTKLKQYNTAQLPSNLTSSPHGALIRQLELVKLVKSAFWNVSEGTVARMWLENISPSGVTGDVYIVNFFTSSSVDAVYAVRTIKEQDEIQTQVFIPIPKSYYEVNLARNTNIVELGGQLVTTIEFSRPLESYTGQGWAKDIIYVTLTSTVGENTADQIKFLLDTYTNLSTDAGSFASVAVDIVKYPSHFSLAKEIDALALAKDMAFQSRCALILDSDVTKIKYLSADPGVPAFDIDESITEYQTMKLSFTPIDEIFTHLTANWRPTGAPEPFQRQFTVVFKNNISKYGVREQDHDFFIYNDRSFVSKSLTFWGNRFSFSWKTVRFNTFTDAMALQIFDDVLISHSVTLLPFSSQPAIVINFEHEVHEPRISLNLWVPVIAGTNDQSEFAYLDDSADTAQPNISDTFNERDYSVNRSVALNIQNIVRDLKVLQRTSKRLIKLKKKSAKFTDKFIADVYDNGAHTDATVEDIEVYVPNPQVGAQEGDWMEVEETGDGLIVADPRVMSRQSRIVEIHPDYFLCVHQDGPVQTILDEPTVVLLVDGAYKVAKPQTLRQTGWDGESIPNVNDEFILYEFDPLLPNAEEAQERTATRTDPSVIVETQVVIQRYMQERTVEGNVYAGSVIMAKYQPAGTGAFDLFGEAIYWEDSNHSGREWAKKFE